MKKDTSYHDFVVYDLMAKLPGITSRPMMSGWAIYSDGIVFAAIIGNQLYLKGTGELAETFINFGWEKFSYQKKTGKVTSMKYWLVPSEVIDDQEGFDAMMKQVFG